MVRQRTVLLWMAGALLALSLGQLFSLVPQLHREVPGLQPAQELWASGIVLRREVAVTADPEINWQLCLPDGSRAAAGQVLLREGAAEVPRGQAAEDLPLIPRRREILRLLQSPAEQPQRPAQRDALVALMLAEGGQAVPKPSEVPGGRTVTAPEAGLFSLGWDGCCLTPEAPWGPIALPAHVPEENVGRLILGDTWYLRTTLPETVAVGWTVKAELPWDKSPLTMEVEALGPEGQALLSCRQSLGQVASLRRLNVKILETSP